MKLLTQQYSTVRSLKIMDPDPSTQLRIRNQKAIENASNKDQDPKSYIVGNLQPDIFHIISKTAVSVR